ncbi:MAG: glutamate--cysteine ligase [Gammaproteobacteria bacterium]|nr:glutamate--cysteine ligase [Gammaproteobacteria bacterium]NNF62325.1 glutamate--cysteine ligase [Gammaproteobacteria bacterium]NNM20889.1 glutamate--cysteine ligase [Gammaproteobacteria bacterium]
MATGDYGTLVRRLGRLSGEALSGRQIGIEKESLRVRPDGRLALTPHPAGLGSALTHSSITTDYSEALLELVTPPANETWCVLQNLVDLHQFVYEQIEDEMLWCASMPCSVSSDDDIPIAQYGGSNVGMMKTVYRRGLGHRYGRMMQAIAGVHFNFSLGRRFWDELAQAEGENARGSDWISAVYLGLIRNFRRYGWLTLYLFGASPAACSSFLRGREADLEEFDGTLFGTNATTLRMSDVGYKNKVQSSLQIPVNNLEEYIAGLEYATATVHPPYRDIGVVVDGEYRQLNANILQIENEYYSLIRPKRVAWSGETPSHALRRGGIEYVEVRALDVSPFDPVGVNQQELRFLEIMLAFCALHDSPPIDAAEQMRIDRNQLETARHGRNPRLMLQRSRGLSPLRDWATELCEQMIPVAELLDAQSGNADYVAALREQMNCVQDPELTPSARVLREMRENSESFYEFALRTSTAHSDYFRQLVGISAERRQQLSEMAEASLQRQREIEAADSISFEEFLARYFSQ